MILEYKLLTTQDQAKEKLTEVNEYLKKLFAVDYVFNYDINALCTWFNHFCLELHTFDREVSSTVLNGYNPDIRTDGKTRVLAVNFEFIGSKIDNSFAFVTGYNKSTPELMEADKKTFYDSKLQLCMYWFDDTRDQMEEVIKNNDLDRLAWDHFKNEVKPKMNTKKLGDKYEIKEPIYWYFLEVLPPIYGKGCFYCSEPCTHTGEGKPVYHKLTKQENKFFIEYNTVN